MQVSVETTSGLERRMTVEVPKEKIEQEVQTRLKNLAHRAKLDGFRPGKVPMKVIEKRYGSQVQQEVMGEVMQSSFYEALSQEKLVPAGQPHIEPKAMAEDASGLEFTATFEVYPEITLSDMNQLSIEKPAVEITDQDIDDMVETIRKQQTAYKAVERKSQSGDRVVINFEGKIDGQPFEGGKAEEYPVELGANRMIPGFEEQLVGVEAGQETTLTVNFPDDYHAANLAGKAATFDVTVHRVEQPELPELDDEFATKMGVKEGGLQAFRDQVKENMQRELDNTIKKQLKQKVMDALLKNNQIEVPKAPVDNEIHALIEQRKQSMGQQQTDIDPVVFEEQARQRVALGLVLSEVIKQHDIKASPAKIREIVEGIAASYETPEEVIKYYYGNTQRMNEIENYALEEEVVDWVLSQANVTEKKATFDEIMNPKPA
ncbi:MAG: trigger factor [Gammaproteobacteria bacterium]|jgi:trigger factor|nr:trigger factor [Gammaproteobacteria bacterium]